MANPFASSTQSSLFPLTFPSVKISNDEYHHFYSYERALFHTLVAVLHFGVNEATLVIGFLLWLERGGYTSYALGKFFHNSLSVSEIDEVADEVLICIKFLQKTASNLMSEGSRKICNISKLQCFLDQKSIHLDELYDYGNLIYDEVCCIATDVSEKAFDGMLNLVTPPDQRTIFLTFSKGYPLSADDVRDYFTGMFGDIIESIHMQPVESDGQPIYARMVVRDPSWVRKVIKGGCLRGKSHYVVNNKLVRKQKSAELEKEKAVLMEKVAKLEKDREDDKALIASQRSLD
ncbi:uncharacterized protein LOC143603065 [Bidens hawaiensis]|uniref:uncharacterized protein LOC143603065 n=1 Tax=Bidens hawaiensis TaxID=980011 RepID=UPI0040496D86